MKIFTNNYQNRYRIKKSTLFEKQVELSILSKKIFLMFFFFLKRVNWERKEKEDRTGEKIKLAGLKVHSQRVVALLKVPSLHVAAR